MNHLKETLHQIGRLKETKRSGWLRKGIVQAESVADHSFRCAVLALLFEERNDVDHKKLLIMALTHDLAESDSNVGDITPFDGVSTEEKHQREKTAMEKICQSLPGGEKIKQLWLEFEGGISKEADIVHQIDALEMIFQAQEYEAKYSINLSDFIETAKVKIQDPQLKNLLEQS
ncbi:MAG: hypothetical protein JWM56_983 [Candidatus Peribacteria bacterium]|nr:hypothetical protein [Candidatus Peribacteria bacterium]